VVVALGCSGFSVEVEVSSAASASSRRRYGSGRCSRWYKVTHLLRSEDRDLSENFTHLEYSLFDVY